MNPFLRYLADKNSARAHTRTDRHTPMTTRPCGLRRAGKNKLLAYYVRCCGINNVSPDRQEIGRRELLIKVCNNNVLNCFGDWTGQLSDNITSSKYAAARRSTCFRTVRPQFVRSQRRASVSTLPTRNWK